MQPNPGTVGPVEPAKKPGCFTPVFIEEWKLQFWIKVGTTKQSGQAEVTQDLWLIYGIRHARCQSSRKYILVVTNCYLAVEREGKLIAYPATAMHLNDQIVTIGTLFFKFCIALFRVSIHFLNTWISNKLYKPINVARKAPCERSSPWQTYQGNFSIRKTSTDRSQRRHLQQKIAEIKCKTDGNL